MILHKDAPVLAAQDGEYRQTEIGEIADRFRIEYGGIQYALHHIVDDKEVE